MIDIRIVRLGAGEGLVRLALDVDGVRGTQKGGS